MKKVLLFLLLTAVLFPKINFGCSCITPDFFCERILDSNGNVRANIMVLRGKTTGSSSLGMEVEISESIYGAPTPQSSIAIRQSFCTIFYGDLEEGEEYIFALTKDDDDNFFALNCSIFFLKIENEMVTGKIAPGVNSIAYEKLGDVEGCGNVFDLFVLEKSILVYPNPTIGEVKIRNTNSAKILGDIELKIFDISGKLLQMYQKVDGLLPEENWKIDLQNLSSGVYIMQLSNRKNTTSFRIVKQ